MVKNQFDDVYFVVVDQIVNDKSLVFFRDHHQIVSDRINKLTFLIQTSMI